MQRKCSDQNNFTKELPDCKTYYKAIVVKTVWYCLRIGSIEQNRVQKETYICGQLVSTQGANVI